MVIIVCMGCKNENYRLMVSASSSSWSRVPISCKAAKFDRTDDWCFSKLGADWDHPPKEVVAGDDGYDGLPQIIWTRSRWWNVLGPHVLPLTPSDGTEIIYIEEYEHWPYEYVQFYSWNLFHYKTTPLRINQFTYNSIFFITLAHKHFPKVFEQKFFEIQNKYIFFFYIYLYKNKNKLFVAKIHQTYNKCLLWIFSKKFRLVLNTLYESPFISKLSFEKRKYKSEYRRKFSTFQLLDNCVQTDIK